MYNVVHFGRQSSCISRVNDSGGGEIGSSYIDVAVGGDLGVKL